MAASGISGVSIAGLSAVNGVSSISAINGIAATIGGGPSLTFFWGMEGATWSNAEVADGSATGTVSDSIASDTGTFKVGAESAGIAGGAFGNVSFSTTSNLSHTQSAIGFWFRCAGFADTRALFRCAFDDDNRFFIVTTAAGRFRWFYKANATGFDETIASGGTMSVDTWYFVILRINQAGNAYGLYVYDDASSLIFSSERTDATGAWAGTPTTFEVGEWTGNGITANWDSFMVSATSSADLYSIRNSTP